MEKKIFWIGENSNPVKKDRLNDYIMDSVINYITIDSPELPYKAKHVFLDNGAFTARTQNLTLDPFKILDLQEKLSPSKVIPLDFPFLPGDTIVKMKKLWEKTKETMMIWQENSNFKGKIVPAVHAWSIKSLDENLQWMQKFVDSDFISFGSIVTKNFSSENHFFGDRQPTKDLIEMLSNAISRTQELTDFKTHVLGIGSSPLMLNIIYYLGAESTDSAGARRKAAYGKIVLPGRGERYLGDGTAFFGRNKKSDKKQRQQILDELKNSCSCEICRNNPNLLETDWKARAIHNEHVLKKEVETIQRLMSQGIDVLERY
ncbi:MAG: hypothetical protein ACTSPP_09225, partial [Candidatus Heimdallarchaeaceae archaeon]